MMNLNKACAWLALGVLVACGNNQSPLTGQLLKAGGELVTRTFQGPQPFVDVRTQFTAETLAGFDKPVILAEYLGNNVAGALPFIARNGRYTTWGSPYVGASYSFLDGVLSGTRGVGYDLLSADVAPVVAALNRGGGSNVPRVHRYLDAENNVVTRAYKCVIIKQGAEKVDLITSQPVLNRYEESCTGISETFVNLYWRERGGFIAQSQVFVHVEVPKVLLQHVVR